MRTFVTPLAEFSAANLDQLAGDSFFASGRFAQVWEAKGGRPVVWCLADAGDVVAVLPGVEFGRRFFKRFMSMPDGCYGGVFCPPELASRKSEFTRPLLNAILSAGYVRTFVFDFAGELELAQGFEVMELETTLVDISQPNWLPPDRKLQSQIRKAEREGIVMQMMDWHHHGDRFMKLMDLTERRHGRRPAFSRHFFERLYGVAQEDSRLHWVWCEYEGHGVCSHIYVVERGILQGWQIYFDKDFSFLKPNQYIRFQTCRLMALQGVHRLNLGGTPENAPGLSYYKKRWGGEPVAYRGLVNRRGIGRLFS